MAPRYAAHRGGAALWPENSLLAFRNSIALGAELLELDVHATADGRVVVIHDATLERTTDGRGTVSACTAEALARLHLRGPDGALTGERPPLLDDVATLVARTRVELLVEIKTGAARARYEGLEASVLSVLEAAGVGARANVMAFDPDVVSRVRALAPRQRTTLLIGRGDLPKGAAAVEAVRSAQTLGASDLGLDYRLIDEAVVTAAHAAAIVLAAWTVNDEAAMRRLLALGVDILTTDRPDVAARVLGERA
ncbi:MAG TPA: glycerophosphodiester phosphodiesterase family protein [Methylomirabilota bacterium]|jgi:glycerophosphoryl diester phosphodiesterase